MKPTLLIMAAGMGSRFGGLKQITPMGPNGATLLDYSVYDALRAGFGKVVFIIRHDIEEDFKEAVGKKWEKKIPVRYVFQELSMVPPGFKVPEGRTKPWGTGHAIWVAQGAIAEPFAVINADDYYGPHSFKALGGYLKKLKKMDRADYSMVGFPLRNTLSDHGTVSRGVCEIAPNGFLRKVVERLKIEKAGKAMRYIEEKGGKHPLKPAAIASMNMWGFTPLLFEQLEKRFEKFLKERGTEEKSEFLIPRVMDELIGEKQAQVKVLKTKDPWFGVTYPEDKPIVYEAIHKLVFKKVYPEKLW